MEFTLLEAFLLGTFYWFTWMDFCIAPLNSWATWQDSVLVGFVLGLAYGDVQQGLYLGGTIGLVFIGANSVGGNLGSDVSLASIIAIPIALKFNWDANTALVVATAFGLVGSFVDTFRRLINSYWHRDAERRIKERKYKSLWIDAFAGPWVVAYIVRAVPLTLLIYFGGTQMGNIVSKLPEWIMNGFTVVGGLLPALGLILCCAMMGRKELYPFFIIGYYMSTLCGWTTLTILVFAVIFALFYMRFTSNPDESSEGLDIDFKALMKVDSSKSELTIRDHARLYMRTLLWFRESQSLEYFFGVGYMYIMKPALEKLYKNDPDGYQEAMLRHLTPFITEPCMGACIHGLSLAMEEEKSKGAPIEGQDIITMETSLMGPMAGLGDSIFWTTAISIIKSICIAGAIAGHWYAAFGIMLWGILANVIGWFSHLIGYNLGGQSIIQLLQKGIFQKILLAVSVIGFTMMGVMTASNAHINAVFRITNDYTIQGFLDEALPGALMMIFCWCGFNYMSKGGKFVKMLLVTTIIGLLCGFAGILG